jgi:BirA family transcriptional regulator, biotin operon repressor / biotin---[acetyl-CoA-carboxylase] ligase
MSPATSPSGELGHPRLHLRLTDSTNARLRELALAGAPHGTLVTAAEQSAGRGRQGRRWSAPPGSSILMSLLLRPAPRLAPLMAAVAVCDVAGGEAAVKWPNDVVVPLDGAPAPGLGKLAGILVEARPQEGWAILGIGINVALAPTDLPPELRDRAGTLGRPPEDVAVVREAVLAALGARLAQPATELLAAWRARDALAGRAVTWEGGQGTADGVDDAGRLRVRLREGRTVALDAGEVHLGTAV